MRFSFVYYRDLSQNSIDSIKSLAFSGMCRLETLLLGGNSIRHLEDGSFYSLKALTTL